jgi:hypothetical protein
MKAISASHTGMLPEIYPGDTEPPPILHFHDKTQ